MTAATTPFAAGSVSLGLHPLTDLPAGEQVEVLMEQARAADRAGFDGVTLPEHHAGFPSYIPQPLLAVNWILAATNRVWSGPAPTVLPLRNPRLFAEEVAWTRARFPGRVGVVLAPGYTASDFDALGESHADRLDEFNRRFDVLMEALRGAGPLAKDPALAACAHTPVPLLLTTNSRVRARQAAQSGAGLLFPSAEGPERLQPFLQLYRESGGTGPVMSIARAWLGEVPETEEEKRWRSAYATAISTAAVRLSPADRVTGSPDHIVDAVISRLRGIGANAVNIRLHVPGAPVPQLLEQIARFGDEVLPALKAGLTS